MVRTYTWNPSTQSSPAILGNFVHEGDKQSTAGSLPRTSANLFCSHRFSDEPIYKSNYENEQVTKMASIEPKKDIQNDTATISSSDGILPTDSSHQHYHMQKFEPFHAAWLHQFQSQPFPVFYPVALDFTAVVPSCCCWRPYLFPPRTISPMMFDQTANLTCIDPWQFRPVQIDGKIYYEPVGSRSHLYGSGLASMDAYSPASASTAVIPNKILLQKGGSSESVSATLPIPKANISAQSDDHQLMHPKEASLPRQSSTSKNTDSMDLPWARGNPQPKSGIRGTRSWHTPTLMQEHSILEQMSNASSTALQNGQYQTAASRHPSDSLNQRYACERATLLQSQWDVRRTAVDSTEQYKRDLQLQIEHNRRRKEEERQRELELERKEMEKFDEYRRKVQQEMLEEERKEKEKIIAAQRKAARIRALQEEAEARASREATDRTRRDSYHESVGTERRRHSSTAESNSLEWWEKKKEYVARKSVHSPVIPALRNNNGASAASLRTTAFEISANDNDTVNSNTPAERSSRTHSSSRQSRRSHHSSVISSRNRSSDSMKQQRRYSPKYEQHPVRSNSSRGNNEYIPESELEREAANSRASTIGTRNFGRMHHSAQFDRPLQQHFD